MHQMSIGGRAPPGPAGGAYGAPQAHSCIETPRAFGAQSSVPTPLASRLRRSETERSGSSFFPFEHCLTRDYES